jgi:uncharacterized protein GlcG (DUF336 family)
MLSLDLANRILAGALAAARAAKLDPLTVVVLDDAGHLKAAAREDGASMFRFDVAFAKAWSAVAMGKPSGVLGERAKTNPVFFTALAATAQGRFLPHVGAVLIHDPATGAVIGAVGASGALGEDDEAACAAGVKAAGLS